MSDNETRMTSAVRAEVHITVTLAGSDQWQRRKVHANSILYRVDTIRVKASSDEPKRIRVTFCGPRILKDGSESTRVYDDWYGNPLGEAPMKVQHSILLEVNRWLDAFATLTPSETASA